MQFFLKIDLERLDARVREEEVRGVTIAQSNDKTGSRTS
jgi:hypothetical protein